MDDTNLTLEEFYELCSNELHFLVEEYGFQEIRAETIEGKYINPYKLIFIRDDLRIALEGINWGQHAMLSIADNNNRIMGTGSLHPNGIVFPKKSKKFKSRATSQTDDIKRHSRELREYGKDLLNGDFSIFDEAVRQQEARRAEREAKHRELKLRTIQDAVVACQEKRWQTVVELLEPYEADLPKDTLKRLSFARKVQQSTGIRKFFYSFFGSR
ncbi:MAG: hypothetical protein GY755_04845 [Chloroflexi bacterium]|nr:hypothetical protein [Chloroflexota bacterium]